MSPFSQGFDRLRTGKKQEPFRLSEQLQKQWQKTEWGRLLPLLDAPGVRQLADLCSFGRLCAKKGRFGRSRSALAFFYE